MIVIYIVEHINKKGNEVNLFLLIYYILKS